MAAKRRLVWLPAMAMLWAVSAGTAAQSPLGLWQTIDDHSGQKRGAVRIYQQAGKFFGRIERSEDPQEAAALCSACRDERFNQPIIGLVILRDIGLVDGTYGGGTILDPDSGDIYRCSFRLSADGSQLILRGYFGIPLLGRSQTWQRLE